MCCARPLVLAVFGATLFATVPSLAAPAPASTTAPGKPPGKEAVGDLPAATEAPAWLEKGIDVAKVAGATAAGGAVALLGVAAAQTAMGLVLAAGPLRHVPFDLVFYVFGATLLATPVVVAAGVAGGAWLLGGRFPLALGTVAAAAGALAFPIGFVGGGLAGMAWGWPIVDLMPKATDITGGAYRIVLVAAAAAAIGGALASGGAAIAAGTLATSSELLPDLGRLEHPFGE